MALAAAVYPNAMTLLEYGLTLPEGSLSRAFVETFVKESDIWRAMPIRPAVQGKFRYEKLAALPSVANRGLNEAGNESLGKFEIGEEGVFFEDEYMKYDRALFDTFGEAGRAKHEQAKVIAMSQNASRLLFSGDTASQPREPNGFKKRFTAADVNLFVNNTGSGGGALSLQKLDIVRRAVNKPTHWVFPYDLLAYVDAAARSPTLTNNMFTQGMDQELGRVVTRYAGLPILYGYDPDDSPVLLQFNEVGSGGGSAVTASIYLLSLDLSNDKCFLVESTPLSVRDEGQIQGQPFYSTNVKWDWGLATVHPRSGARLSSITKATIVA